MFKQYIVKITPRANSKEDFVKRRCYLTMAKSQEQCKKQAIEGLNFPRSSYKLEVVPYTEQDKYKYVRGIDGELIEVTDFTEKPTEENENEVSTNQDEVTNTETEKNVKSEYQAECNSNGKPLRTRRFCLTSYIEPSALSEYVKALPWVQHWAMCTHDKDIEKNGTPKQLHTHVLLYTFETKTSSAIKKKFDNFSIGHYKGTDTQPQNTLVQICHDMSAQWRYLVHADDDDKYPYPKETRKCDDLSYWNTLDKTFGMNDTKGNVALAIISDINDSCSVSDLVLRYGREYVINRYKYHECAERIRTERQYPLLKKWDIHEALEMCLAGIHHRTDEEKRIFLEMFNEVQVECTMTYGERARIIIDDRTLVEYEESAERVKEMHRKGRCAFPI